MACHAVCAHHSLNWRTIWWKILLPKISFWLSSCDFPFMSLSFLRASTVSPLPYYLLYFTGRGWATPFGTSVGTAFCVCACRDAVMHAWRTCRVIQQSGSVRAPARKLSLSTIIRNGRFGGAGHGVSWCFIRQRHMGDWYRTRGKKKEKGLKARDLGFSVSLYSRLFYSAGLCLPAAWLHASFFSLVHSSPVLPSALCLF